MVNFCCLSCMWDYSLLPVTIKIHQPCCKVFTMLHCWYKEMIVFTSPHLWNYNHLMQQSVGIPAICWLSLNSWRDLRCPFSYRYFYQASVKGFVFPNKEHLKYAKCSVTWCSWENAVCACNCSCWLSQFYSNRKSSAKVSVLVYFCWCVSTLYQF